MPETTLKEQILDLFFPAACLGCGTCGSLMCGRCLADLAGVAAAQSEERRCRVYASPAFSDFRAAGDYLDLLKEMVIQLKSSQRPLAEPLSRLMLAAAGNEPVYLAPERVFFVPSEKRKIRQRGYNPAELLALLIARHIGRPLERSLIKVKRTLDQDCLSGRERRLNVEGAFAVSAGSRVCGRVLLVDDVLTTGATVDCCARALVDAGAESVSVLVAARSVFNSR